MTTAESIIVTAIVFLVLFIIGGVIGVLALPEFTARFYVSGLIFGIVGTGLSKFVFHLGGKNNNVI